MKDSASYSALFDLHCDTLTELFDRGESLADNTCHISLSHGQNLAPWHQVFAIWSRHDLDSEAAFHRFFDVLAATLPALRQAQAQGKMIPYLAVEDGVLLGEALGRLDLLAAVGVRILTLVWRDTNAIGGAHNTDTGLTPFGVNVVHRAMDLGIVPDLSHASDATFFDTLAIARERGKPVIASHSDARALCPHRRNVTDEMIDALVEVGGLCGINLCHPFLTTQSTVGIDDIVVHILHFLDRGARDILALGCDLDGIDSLPEGMTHVGDLPRIADALASRGIDDDTIERIFYRNAASFFDREGITPLFPASIGRR